VLANILEIRYKSVSYAITCHDEKSHIDYEIRLRAVVGVVRFFFEQCLAFCGHAESSTSLNKGNFREMLDWHGARCNDVAGVINDESIMTRKLMTRRLRVILIPTRTSEVLYLDISIT
jgi:hypothetical protein